MSLINEALKRAKQAQGQTPAPTAPGPQLRPVEPVAAISPSLRLAMTGITVAAIGLALFLAWRLVRTNGSVQPGPAVQQIPSAVAASQPAPIAQHAPVRVAEPTAAMPPSATPAITLGTPAEARSSSASDPAAAAPGAVATTIVATNAPTAPEKPAPPKLQGIMYQPGHPAAMISGKMVFVGDKLGAWRVAAIDQESATLIGAGQTNILTLPQ